MLTKSSIIEYKIEYSLDMMIKLAVKRDSLRQWNSLGFYLILRDVTLSLSS